MKPDTPGPFRDAQGFPLKGNEMIATCVLHLFAMCCPSAVAGFVVSVHVDAVDAVTLRSLSHVAEKQLERLSPSIADSDSSTSIVFVPWASRSGATLNNCTPYTVFCRVLPVVAVPVCSTCVSYGDATNTTAVSCVSAFQVVAAGLKHCPTLALTPPQISDLFCSAVFASEAKNCRHTKRLVGYIHKTRPSWNWRKYKGFSFHGCSIMCDRMISRDKG